MTILDRRLLIVGGKGGTGKSSVAAALAELASLHGKRTLLISADGSPGAAGMFGITPNHRSVEVAPNLHVSQIDSNASLNEFIKLQLGRLGAVAGPVAKALSFVAEAAPGVSELLLVGKYAEEVRSGDWDLVVVDAASSGHLLGELAAPEGVAALAPIGRLSRETGWLVDLLADPDITGVVNLTLAEEVPVSETLEFVDRLHRETPATLAAVIVNRTRPQLYTVRSRIDVDELLASPPTRSSIGAMGLLDAIQIGLDRADVASAIDARLRRELPAGMPIVHIPEFGVVDSLRRSLRDAIADELSL